MRLRYVFLLSALLFGFLFWSTNDWWTYIPSFDGSPPRPKLYIPLPLQILESAVVGGIAAAALTCVIGLLRELLRKSRDTDTDGRF